jgi:hypothetical protein
MGRIYAAYDFLLGWRTRRVGLLAGLRPEVQGWAAHSLTNVKKGASDPDVYRDRDVTFTSAAVPAEIRLEAYLTSAYWPCSVTAWSSPLPGHRSLGASIDIPFDAHRAGTLSVYFLFERAEGHGVVSIDTQAPEFVPAQWNGSGGVTVAGDI